MSLGKYEREQRGIHFWLGSGWFEREIEKMWTGWVLNKRILQGFLNLNCRIGRLCEKL